MARRRRRFGPLSNRNYRLYFCGNALSLIGTWIQRIGVGWLGWELTHSAAFLGLLAVAELLPSLVIGPFGGAAADRMNRLRLIGFTQGVLCVQAVSLSILALTGALTSVGLFLLTLVLGIVTAFGQPARMSLVPSLVSRRHIQSAVALNSVSWNGARFVGPALAAIVIAEFGVAWTFVANAASFSVFLVVLPLMRVAPHPGEGGKHRNLFVEIGEGFAHVWRHPGVGPLVMLLLASAVLVRPYVELLPGFADLVFDRGAEGFSILTAAGGIGAVLGGLCMAVRGGKPGLTRIVFLCTALQAVAIGLFAVTGNFSFAVGLLATSGFTMVIAGVGAQGLIQANTAASLLGRVLSVYGLTFRAGPAIGALLMGALADWLGLAWPVLGGAVACLAVWAWIRRGQVRIAEALRDRPARTQFAEDGGRTGLETTMKGRSGATTQS